MSRIAVPAVALLEQQPVDGLDGAHVQAARGLDRHHEPGSELISRARMSRCRLPPESSRASVSTDGAATW